MNDLIRAPLLSASIVVLIVAFKDGMGWMCPVLGLIGGFGIGIYVVSRKPN